MAPAPSWYMISFATKKRNRKRWPKRRLEGACQSPSPGETIEAINDRLHTMTQEEPSSTKSTAGVTDQTVQHPAFPQPADPHVTIWRYMDIAKFADIVTHRRL
jgi:hypothetical protein